MDLQQIVTYMQSKGLGTPGQTLFAYSMPDQINAGLLVTSQVAIARHPYAPGLRKGEFQVIARGHDHQALINQLNSVSNALSVQGQVIGSMNFRFIQPIHDPLVFPRADSRLLEASVNFQFAFTQSL